MPSLLAIYMSQTRVEGATVGTHNRSFFNFEQLLQDSPSERTAMLSLALFGSMAASLRNSLMPLPRTLTPRVAKLLISRGGTRTNRPALRPRVLRVGRPRE
jgi:hypothetical protein